MVFLLHLLVEFAKRNGESRYAYVLYFLYCAILYCVYRPPTPLMYDKKGNLTQNEQGQKLSWDVENRLITAVSGASTNGYGYDALGRRLALITIHHTRILIIHAVRSTAVS